MSELIILYSVKILGALIRALPVNVALGLGRAIGSLAYYFNIKRKSQVYANLKAAFVKTKSPAELKKISKGLFQNYGQNFIELLRLPLVNEKNFEQYVQFEGREHVAEALKKEKGVILLAMHFGSWEFASLAGAMLGRPYKMMVKPQKRFSKLDDLLNSYRNVGGSVVIERGLGTRQLIKGLHNNEIIGMVVDQGGKDGVLVPFFERQASMSVGAIRIALKLGVPICFAVIFREKGAQHRLIIHKELELTNTGDEEADVKTNLHKITALMEQYIRTHPTEYMWFYKIWKYSKESVIVVLDDGKAGHRHQSQTVAVNLNTALSERGISCATKTFSIKFKNRFSSRLMSVLSLVGSQYIYQGRLDFLKYFLTPESFDQIMSIKADFVISCGSSLAALNHVLSGDQQAKSIVVLKPGLLGFKRFDLVILPEHDVPKGRHLNGHVAVTKGAPNFITDAFLAEQSRALLKHYSHLKLGDNFRIGLFLGGDTKNYILPEQTVRVVINQIKEISDEIKADILISTSRRTSGRIEGLVQRELKKYSRCKLIIIPNRNDIPEGLGGILGLADVVVVSGDSISMVSEAASSGKKVVVFPVQDKARVMKWQHKHGRFIEIMQASGYISLTAPQHLKEAVYGIMKNKIVMRRLDDNKVILDAVKNII